MGFLKENAAKDKIFKKRAGIFVKILPPLLLLAFPLVVLSYSDFLFKLLSPIFPEKIIQKILLQENEVEIQFRVILVLTVILALCLGMLIARRLSGALEKVSAGLKEVLTGNLNFQIEIEDRDEIGEITFLLNKIVENSKETQLELKIKEKEVEAKTTELSQRIKDLEFSRKEIEESRLATLNILEDVEEARLNLLERLEELEKFNKLSVGRELRMIELKEEIKKLKNGIE